MPKKNKTSKLTDEDIFLMSEGLTEDLIAVKNEQLRDEFLQYKAEAGLEEDDDDTDLYRSFIGHKLAVLLNTVEHLLRENKRNVQMFIDAMKEIADALRGK